MKRILFLLFVAISIVGCAKEDENANINKEEQKFPAPGTESLGCNGSFMEGFYSPISINLTAVDGGIIIEINRNHPKKIRYHKNMTEQEESIYNEYVKYYGDTLYVAPHYVGSLYSGCKFPIDNISIVADKDFDSNHIAGQELNDLFRLRPEYLFMGFIESGYDINYDYYMAKDYPLQDVSDFKLLSEKSILLLTPRPSTPGDFTFTVTINFLPDPVSGEECESIKQAITMKF